MNLRHSFIALGLGCVVALSSCATDTTTSAPPPDDLAYAEALDTITTTTITLIDGIPDVELDDDELQLVLFEANWVCELQRRTFQSPDAMQQALNDKLVGLGVERATYDAFRAEVNNSQDLRDSILYAYQENCRA